MADYSEFPTTPTAWQEAQAADWQTVTPLATEEQTPQRRVDRTALAAGLLFVALAVIGMTGLDLPDPWVDGGGPVWLILVLGGVALLVRELRRARRRR